MFLSKIESFEFFVQNKKKEHVPVKKLSTNGKFFTSSSYEIIFSKSIDLSEHLHIRRFLHISNIFQQGVENTKPIQVPKCEVGFVSGLGIHSYDLAIRAVNKKLRKN